MSKQIKQMEMDALKRTFADVRDLVYLSVSGVDATADNQMRLGLRKKSIRMQVVKNSLAKRVFTDLGIASSAAWEGPTLVAWGAGSLSELSRELDAIIKKNDKIKVKSAIAEGQEVTFKQALSMPTKAEAIGRIVTLVQSPMARLLAQLQSPGGRLVGQLKSMAEKGDKDEAKPEEAPAAG